MATTTPDYTATQNDIPGSVIMTVTDDADVIQSLVGATSITFSMRLQNGSVIKINEAVAYLWTDPDDSVLKLRYDWVAGDLDTVGKYWAEFEFVLGGCKYSVPTNPKLFILVVVEVA